MKLVELIRTPVLLAAGYFAFTGMRAAEHGVPVSAAVALVAAIAAAVLTTLAYFALGGE